MAHDTEHQPGAVAPTTGRYRLLNVLGSPTPHTAHVRRGETLPDAARGQGWRLDSETEDDE
jgi:hypothetical protein